MFCGLGGIYPLRIQSRLWQYTTNLKTIGLCCDFSNNMSEPSAQRNLRIQQNRYICVSFLKYLITWGIFSLNTTSCCAPLIEDGALSLSETQAWHCDGSWWTKLPFECRKDKPKLFLWSYYLCRTGCYSHVKTTLIRFGSRSKYIHTNIRPVITDKLTFQIWCLVAAKACEIQDNLVAKFWSRQATNQRQMAWCKIVDVQNLEQTKQGVRQVMAATNCWDIKPGELLESAWPLLVPQYW